MEIAAKISSEFLMIPELRLNSILSQAGSNGSSVPSNGQNLSFPRASYPHIGHFLTSLFPNNGIIGMKRKRKKNGTWRRNRITVTAIEPARRMMLSFHDRVGPPPARQKRGVRR